MSKLRKLAAFTGVFTVGAALTLIFRPELGAGLPALGETLRIIIAALIAVILGIYALKSFSFNSVDKGKLYLYTESPPEEVRDPDAKLGLTREAEKDDLRDTVIRILESKDIDNPEDYLAKGGWTQDDVAAAFIEEELNYPVLERLREWIEDSGTRERRIEITVEAVEKLHAGEDV